MGEHVVLVDKTDVEIGTMEKQAAHEAGILHRAFSIFVFNKFGELLLQQRASCKYHSPNLWTNTCCSHPRKGETYLAAAHRRLKEEMGFDCKLSPKFNFIYKADLGNGLFEHELDHVFVGNYDKNPILNLEEVSNFRWVSMQDLQSEMKQSPEGFTVWFHIILNEYLNQLK